jgi:predicted DNA-binding transcriptional regulator YafY
MARNDQVNRVLNILHQMLTQQCGVTLTELAERHAVSAKTIRRDVKAIEVSAFQLCIIHEKGRKCYTAKVQVKSLENVD